MNINSGLISEKQAEPGVSKINRQAKHPSTAGSAGLKAVLASGIAILAFGFAMLPPHAGGRR